MEFFILVIMLFEYWIIGIFFEKRKKEAFDEINSSLIVFEIGLESLERDIEKLKNYMEEIENSIYDDYDIYNNFESIILEIIKDVEDVRSRFRTLQFEIDEIRTQL